VRGEVEAKLKPSTLVVPGAVDNPEKSKIFIQLILDTWKHFSTSLRLISEVLMYMVSASIISVEEERANPQLSDLPNHYSNLQNKNFCRLNKVPSSWEAGLFVFRDEVLRSSLSPIRPTLRTCLLHQIACERNGMVIDASVIKQVLDMMISMGESMSDPLGMFIFNLSVSSICSSV
jgi:cullin 3